MNAQFAIQAGALYVLEVNPARFPDRPSSRRRSECRMAEHAALLATANALGRPGASLPEREPLDFFIKGPVFPVQEISRRGHAASVPR